MKRAVLILFVLLAGPAAARADETDDALARRLVGVVRDFRQPLAARVEAARTLAKLGPRAAAAVKDLILVLERLSGAEQEPLQEAIIDALGQTGTAGRPALPTLAKTSGRTIDIDLAIKRATDNILSAPDAEDVELLAQQLTARDAGTRLRAAKALGDLGPAAKAAVPALTVALADADGDVRRAVIAALRFVQPATRPSPELVRAVAVDLKNPDANLRLLAARTLGRMGPAAAAAAADLDALRTDPDPDVRRAATEALAKVAAPLP